jgi:hypothetical protein
MTTGATGRFGIIVFASVLACGCADSGLNLTTGTLGQGTTAVAAKTDPVCASLTSQIRALKDDGTIDRLEQAASGKTAKVSIKRTALQKQAELNKAYGEFQTHCGPVVPGQVAAQKPATAAIAAPQTANAAPAPAAPATAKTDAD